MISRTISLPIPKLKLLGEGHVNPDWLINMSTTPSLPWNRIRKTYFLIYPESKLLPKSKRIDLLAAALHAFKIKCLWIGPTGVLSLHWFLSSSYDMIVVYDVGINHQTVSRCLWIGQPSLILILFCCTRWGTPLGYFTSFHVLLLNIFQTRLAPRFYTNFSRRRKENKLINH